MKMFECDEAGVHRSHCPNCEDWMKEKERKLRKREKRGLYILRIM
jgi:hypothetical protein